MARWASARPLLPAAAAAAAGMELVEAGALATLSWLPYLPFRRALGHEPLGADAAYVARELIAAVGGSVLLLDDVHGPTRRRATQFRSSPAGCRSLPPCAGSAARPIRSSTACAGGIRAPGARAARAGRGARSRSEPPTGSRARAGRPDRSPLRRQSLAPRRALRRRESRLRAWSWRCSASSLARTRLAAGPGLLAVVGRPLDAASFPRGRTARQGCSRCSTARSRSGTRFSPRSLQASSATTSVGAPRARCATVALPGEAARHHAAAGERVLAYERALEAAATADRPGSLPHISRSRRRARTAQTPTSSGCAPLPCSSRWVASPPRSSS